MDLHSFHESILLNLEQTITSSSNIDQMAITVKLHCIENSMLLISYSIATATVYAEMLSTNIVNLKTVFLSLHC